MNRFLILALSLSACCHLANSPPATPANAQVGAMAWDALKAALPGSWTMPGKSGPFTVHYKLISGASALVEEWGPGTPSETETVFAKDQDALLLTHYCAQGNQPRLRATEQSSAGFVFRFDSVTNRLPGQSMLVKRVMRLEGATLDDTEVYEAPDGTPETTTYRFTRAAP